MRGSRKRLDELLLERGLVESRTKAQALIRAGYVTVDGRVVDKPGTRVPGDASIHLKRLPRYVSRGGEKLEGAFRAFEVDPRGKVCLDIGSSTGGFVDCLLQHGAVRVYAVDVGKGLLHWKLRRDPRVVVLEGINARYLAPEEIGEPVDLVTVDVSFISLRLILPALRGIVKPEGEVLALVKPQFEAGREKVERGGVVRDPLVHLEVLRGLGEFVQRELGWSIAGSTHSPLLGPAGNIEFFVHILPRPAEGREVPWEEVVSRAWDELLGGTSGHPQV